MVILGSFPNNLPSELIRLNCPEAAMRSLQLARQHASTEHERLVYEGWILYDTGHCNEGLQKAEESINIKKSFEAFSHEDCVFWPTLVWINLVLPLLFPRLE